VQKPKTHMQVNNNLKLIKT